jgi:hypothetical protein
MASGDSIRVTGTLVGTNVAVHRAAGSRDSAPLVWDVTQVSSGLRIGRFQSMDAANFYGETISRTSEAIRTGEPLTQEEASELATLRRNCGGSRW